MSSTANEPGHDTKQDPSKAVAWYKPDTESVPPDFQDLLHTYSNIPLDGLVSHVNKVRDRAWKVAPYPCIGGWRFLELNMTLSPAYASVLSRLQQGEKLLDLGCGLGQDLRKLIRDGVPAANVNGVDLSEGLIAAGFDMFLDTDTSLRGQIFTADIFGRDDSRLMQLDGQIDIVFAGSFFHLFDWDEQVSVAKRVAKLLQARAGSMIFGHHLGHARAGLYPYGLASGRKIFKHDVESFVQLWAQVAEETGSTWNVEATLHVMEAAGFGAGGQWGDVDGRLMRFCVQRM